MHCSQEVELRYGERTRLVRLGDPANNSLAVFRRPTPDQLREIEMRRKQAELHHKHSLVEDALHEEDREYVTFSRAMQTVCCPKDRTCRRVPPGREHRRAARARGAVRAGPHAAAAAAAAAATADVDARHSGMLLARGTLSVCFFCRSARS